MSRTPWVGLAALIAMFVIPYLPTRFFEGPRTVKHWPRRHVCGNCEGPWTDGHTCVPTSGIPRLLRGELWRRESTADVYQVSGSRTLRSGQQRLLSDPVTSRDGSLDLHRKRTKRLSRMS
jgi:hypothetical protein